MEARKAEMVYFKKMNVYEKVPKSECDKESGKAPRGVRWVDVNKQDEKYPLYRSRLVAKDYNNSKEPDLYTATPRLEFLRLIVSLAASSQDKMWKAVEIYGQRCQPCLILRAKFEAHVCLDLCRRFRAGDEHRCGKLLVSV